MPDYITLMGSEQVQSAARQIASAADEMKRAANQFDESVRALRAILSDTLQEFERIKHA